MKPGDKLPYRNGIIKVMAIANGWAMVRYPRATPFVVRVKEILTWIKFVKAVRE